MVQLTEGAPHILSLAEVHDAVLGPRSAVLFGDGPEGPELICVGPAETRSYPLPADTRWVKCGLQVAVVAWGSNLAAIDLDPAARISLPMGAAGNRTVPFAARRGLAWSDGFTVYAWDLVGPVRMVGTVDTPVVTLAAHEETILARTKSGATWSRSPGGLLARAEQLDSSELLAPLRPVAEDASWVVGADCLFGLLRTPTGSRLICVELDSGRVRWSLAHPDRLSMPMAWHGGLMVLDQAGELLSFGEDGQRGEAPEELPDSRTPQPLRVGPLTFDDSIQCGDVLWAWSFEGLLVRSQP